MPFLYNGRGNAALVTGISWALEAVSTFNTHHLGCASHKIPGLGIFRHLTIQFDSYSNGRGAIIKPLLMHVDY